MDDASWDDIDAQLAEVLDEKYGRAVNKLLRHTPSNRLYMRPDGFVRLEDVTRNTDITDYEMEILAATSRHRGKLRFEWFQVENTGEVWVRALYGHSRATKVDPVLVAQPARRCFDPVFGRPAPTPTPPPPTPPPRRLRPRRLRLRLPPRSKTACPAAR